GGYRVWCLVLSCSGVTRALPAVPTRRSSDLAAQRDERGVVQDAHVLDDAVLLAVARHVADAQAQRLLGGAHAHAPARDEHAAGGDRKSTRLNSSHVSLSYAVLCCRRQTARPC